ncbi:hypothetical protein Btru_037981 [Bulinus truncatus]|nr:hypothetical protein Btru_037981 [Bulinus truncatus]
MTHLPEVKAHETVSEDVFLKSFLEPLMKDSTENAVVFLQDKLHVDDFTKYADVYSVESDGGAFRNVKDLMENHFSLELPQVLNPDIAVEKLKSSYNTVHIVKSLKDVENLDFSGDGNFLLIVNLQPIHKVVDQEKALKQNDKTVGDISHLLQKRSIKYSALFTAYSAGEALNSDAESHANRHLMEASYNNNGTGVFMNASDGNIFVFLRGGKICIRENIKPDYSSYFTQPCVYNATLTPTEDTANMSKSSNTTANIVLNFPGISNGSLKSDLQLLINAEKYVDKWIMKELILNITFEPGAGFNESLQNATLSKGSQDLTISVLYSYHCTEMKMFLDFKHQKDLDVYMGSYIILDGFQVQAFRIQNNRFSYAQDCVPYFTTAIWMALFSSAFLLLILFFGTIMVLNLSIMDRYDDPKGKTIVVNAGAE